MPIGKVWIYHLLFVCLFFVCTITDFSGEDKASGIKFCAVVYRRPGHGISHFGDLCFPRIPKSDESAIHPEEKFRVGRATVMQSRAYEVRVACARRCGYTAIFNDGRTC